MFGMLRGVRFIIGVYGEMARYGVSVASACLRPGLRMESEFKTAPSKPWQNASRFATQKIPTALLITFLILTSIPGEIFANEFDPNYINQSEVSSHDATHNISGQNGSFSYDYSFALPPGINGHMPELGLEYNSAAPSDHDIAGYGWSLSIPYIKRINKTGIENLYTDDHYTSSFSGELVKVSETEYRAKVETGDHLMYTRIGDGWEVTTKNGTKYVLGDIAATRQDDPVDPTKIHQWMTSSISDSNGNIISYTYLKDQGQIYPSTISYADGKYTVDITYEDKNHNPTSYATLFPVVTSKKIKSISTFDNDAYFRDYRFSYTTGDNGVRSILSEIGDFESNLGQVLPPTKFSYEKFGHTDDYNSNPAYNFGETQIHDVLPDDLGYFFDRGTRYVDMNGDGMMDAIRFFKVDNRDDSHYSWEIKRVHLATETGGWDLDVAWDWSDIDQPLTWWSDGVWYNTSDTYDMGARMVDVNGDGRSDYVIGWTDGRVAGGGNSKVYLNTGSGFELSSEWVVPRGFVGWIHTPQGNYYRSAAAGSFLDINADGLVDIVYAYIADRYNYTHPYWSQNHLRHAVYINTGDGWVENQNFTLPSNFYIGQQRNSMSDYGVRYADLNDDGLIDVSKGYDRHNTDSDLWYEYDANFINTGTSFLDGISDHPTATHVTSSPSGQNNAYRYMDVNGDGVTDLTRAWDNGVYGAEQIRTIFLNDGENQKVYNWEKCCSVPSTKQIRYPINLGVWWRFDPPQKNPGHLVFDYDGDGLVDIISGEPLTSTGPTTLDSEVIMHGVALLQPSKVKDLLIQIENEEGGVTDIEYQGFREQAGNDASVFKNALSNPQVVTSIAEKRADGVTATSSYKYENGAFYFDENDVRDRRYAGFGKVTKTTDDKIETTYYHQTNGDDGDTDEVGDSEAKIGFPYRHEVREVDGDLLERTITRYKETDLGSDATSVLTESILTERYGAESTERETAIGYQYDTVGNPTVVTEYGEVSGDADSTFTDTKNDTRTTEMSYATKAGAITSYPTLETKRDDSGAIVAHTSYRYDGLAQGVVDKGNVTTIIRDIDGTNTASENYTYDSYGNPLTHTDAESNTTTYTYDAFNLYPETVTNALGHTTAHEYDYRHGQVIKTTDPNGIVAETDYDGFGRPTAKRATNPSGTLTIIETNVYDDFSTPRSVHTTSYKTADGQDTHTYLDGFGRTLQTKSETANGNYQTKTFTYDSAGRVKTETLPYVSGGNSYNAAEAAGETFITYTYDALDRPLSVSSPTGVETTNYRADKKTVTNKNGIETDYEYDAYDNLIKVTERVATPEIPDLEGETEESVFSPYNYRQAVTLKGEAGAGVDYQVLLKIGKVGVESGADLWLNNNALSFPQTRNDGGDLAFYDDDQETLLPFWVEKVENDVAYVWVKVVDNLDTDQTIYLYYGHSTPTNYSDGEGTFDLFDEFEGTTLDTSKWTHMSGTVVVANGQVSVGNTQYGGHDYIDSLQSFDTNYQLKWYGQINAEGWTTPRDGFVDPALNKSVTFRTRWQSSGVRTLLNTGEMSTTVNEGHTGAFHIKRMSTGEADFYIDDVMQPDSQNPWSGAGNIRIHSGTNYDVVDYLFVAKHTDTEPTVLSAGSEEAIAMVHPDFFRFATAETEVDLGIPEEAEEATIEVVEEEIIVPEDEEDVVQAEEQITDQVTTEEVVELPIENITETGSEVAEEVAASTTEPVAEEVTEQDAEIIIEVLEVIGDTESIEAGEIVETLIETEPNGETAIETENATSSEVVLVGVATYETEETKPAKGYRDQIRIDRLEGKITEKEFKIAELKLKRQQVRQSLANVRAARDKTKDKITELKDTIEKRQERGKDVSNQKDRLDRLKNKRDRQNKRIDRLKERRDNLKDRIERLGGKIDDFQDRLKRIEARKANRQPGSVLPVESDVCDFVRVCQ